MEPNEYSSTRQVLFICILSLTGLSYGMLFSWTSPSIPEVITDKTLNITLEEASYFTIIPQISTVLASPLYASLLNKYGRKKLVLGIGIPQLLAWIITIFANNIIWFYAARLVTGIGDAGVYTVVSLYIAEVAEPCIRSSWATALPFFMAVGKFLVIVIGAYTTIKHTAIIGACITIVHIIPTVFIPESPYYLLMTNREDYAKKALLQLKWRLNTDEANAKLKDDVNRQLSETGKYLDLFKIKSNRKALKIAIGLRFAVQYSGLYAFQTYAQYMFEQTGGAVSEKTAASVFASSCVLLSGLFGTILTRFDRRKLLIVSCVGCSIVLTVETTYFAIKQFTNAVLDYWSWIPLVGMILYLVFVYCGLSFIPIVMQGELFSASIKTKASSIVSTVAALNNIVVPKLFQTLTYNFGIFTPFAVFSCCTMLSAAFCYVCVVETKGKTLEEIQQELKKPTKQT